MDFADFPAFEGLKDTQIAHLTGVGEAIQLLPGEEVIEQGTRAERLYLFTSGRLSVHVSAGPTEYELATLEAPCVVGEIELLHDGDHAASVTALDVCDGLVIPYGPLRRRLADGDLTSLRFATNLARLVAARLHKLDHRFAELIQHPPEPSAEMLADLSNKMLLRKLMEW